VSRDVRLVRALVACYPSGWRRRYGDEYAQLLCDLRIHRRPTLIVDSLRGAVRAHGGALMASRSPMTIVVWAAGLFTVAGIGFAKLAEDFTDRGGSAYALLVGAAAVALLALAAAAAPTAAALLGGRAAGARKYLAVPVGGALVWYGAVRLALAVSAGHGVHSAWNRAGFVLIGATGVAVVAATAWAAATVLHRVPTASPAWLWPAAVWTVVGGMAVATLAAVIWGLQVRSTDPSGFHGDQGFLATPFVPNWIALVVALAAATALAGMAGMAELRAEKGR
jgi:hypothetical protein